MSGRYLCIFVAVAAFFAVNCSAQAVTVQPTMLSGEEGEDFTFTCNGPSNQMGWYRKFTNGTEAKLVESDEFSVVIVIDGSMATGTLVIKNALPEKSGQYSCKVTSPDAAFEVGLTVYAVKDVMISPSEPEFLEGGSMYLNCTVNGANDMPVRWYINNGQEISELTGGDESTHIQVFTNGSLAVRTLTPEDAGIYICNHTFTQGSKAAEVNVGGEITLTSDNSVKFTEGDRALLKCEAHVITPALLPTFDWLVDGAEWQTACANRCKVESKSTTHTVTSQLEINKITMEDRLNYTCIATNSATEVSKDILLRVRDRLAALWPFLGIVTEVVILIIIIFIHEKCSKGEDIGEEDEDEDDLKKEKPQINDGDGEMRMRSSKQ